MKVLLMHRLCTSRNGLASLELLLAIAIAALLIQCFPVLWPLLDVRNWSRTIWFVANLVVLLVLLTVRFLPNMLEDLREMRIQRTTDRAKAEKARILKEQKEATERLQRSRSRRLY